MSNKYKGPITSELVNNLGQQLEDNLTIIRHQQEKQEKLKIELKEAKLRGIRLKEDSERLEKIIGLKKEIIAEIKKKGLHPDSSHSHMKLAAEIDQNDDDFEPDPESEHMKHAREIWENYQDSENDND